MLKESLYIYTIDEDGNKSQFQSVKDCAVLSEWTFAAERMAGAPTITGSLMHRLCLDDLWSKKEFVEFNGERYFVGQIPTSSKNTEDVRYKHDITFTSERIVLENVFFFDVVTSETEEQYKDRYRSNNTKLSFFGTLYEFVSRLNDSLIYTKLYNPSTGEGYHIVIDEGISVSEEKEISLENVYFATALQEIYSKFKIPYYWKGKTCHVGNYENLISTPFEYGNRAGLVSIARTNENFRIINRITGIGSSENLPYYYPNTEEYGTAVFTTYNIPASSVSVNLSKISEYNHTMYGMYVYVRREENVYDITGRCPYYDYQYNNRTVEVVASAYPKTTNHITQLRRGFDSKINTGESTQHYIFRIKGKKGSEIEVDSRFKTEVRYLLTNGSIAEGFETLESKQIVKIARWEDPINDDMEVEIGTSYQFIEDGDYRIHVIFNNIVYKPSEPKSEETISVILTSPVQGLFYNLKFDDTDIFMYDDGRGEISYEESGILLSDKDSAPYIPVRYIFSEDMGEWIQEDTQSFYESAAKVNITDREWITPSENLMPPIYRESGGAERFYNAVNGTYDNPEGGEYSFNNLYYGNNPKEGIQTFDDIKPSIKGIRNSFGHLFGEIADIAFDSDDSDNVDEDGNYIHSYFYVKLHIFNGTYGFNLFKHALAQGGMTFNMTSGNCAPCAFEAGVSEPRYVDGHYEFDNPVQVDENGDIVSGSYADKVKFDNIQPRQQDTSKYGVWVALKKENSTYGVVMPNATNNYKPNIGDTFVITNISLPYTYITKAEKDLEDAIIKYMWENNEEKFSFSITFSRIYLQDNPDISAILNENSCITVKYNNHEYILYVSSYSCKVTEDILCEISVVVTAELSIGQSSLMEKISAVTQDVIRSGNVDIVPLLQKKFLSKVYKDRAKEQIVFERGAEFGNFIKSLYLGAGGSIDENGNAEFESLRVRSSMEVMELIVNRLAGIEGDQILTETDTIDSIDDLGNNCYGLHLHPKWEGYFTAQAVGNVLKGIINNLGAIALGMEGYGSRAIYTSWMRVNSVNTAMNYLEVTLYPDEDVPAGKNFPPCEMMKVARWGNQTDKRRQSCLYMSSTEGRIVKLSGVTKPIIDETNYGATFGSLPDFLKDKGLPIVEGQDYMYARGIIVQDFIQTDYNGKPVSSIVDRGKWSSDEDYYSESLNPETGMYEISDVWYMGCKWRCTKTGTKTPPAWNNTDWAMIEGNPAFTVDFAETDFLFDPDNFNTTLTVVAHIYNMDVTDDILDTDVQWTRYSEDAEGNPRVASDNAWAMIHANSGKSISLTRDDCDFDGYIPKVLTFTATVTLRDGMGNEASTAQASFSYY